VTGSSDGIGYAVARSLAQEGARVVLCARREPLLAEARQTIEKETGAEVLAVPCDVQRLGDVQRLVGEIIQRFGIIHILVNNAGSVPSIRFADIDDAHWYQMLEGKLLGYIRMTREIVPHMRKAGWGRIINIAGTAGWEPSHTAMAVGLNNAAVMNWTKSLSLECAEDGILVTTVAPGSIETRANFAIVSGRPTSPARVSMSSATRACATSRCTGLAERKKRLAWSSFSPQNIPVT
jgi:3-oxoacyl-[acyl-carrier protein] reductase